MTTNLILNPFPEYQDKNLTAIKDQFDMIASVSFSSFVATGLALKSLDDAQKPAYFAEDIGRLLRIKEDLINDFYLSRPEGYDINPILIYVFLALFLYIFGIYWFDNSEIEKAYKIIEVYIEK